MEFIYLRGGAEFERQLRKARRREERHTFESSFNCDRARALFSTGGGLPAGRFLAMGGDSGERAEIVGSPAFGLPVQVAP